MLLPFLAHLAPTYAAVNALAIIGTPAAYNVINRALLYQWLFSLRLTNGAFVMHIDGEVDSRGPYCAASAALLVGIDFFLSIFAKY